MRELSLNVMDITQNSITAKASLIAITVSEDTPENRLVIGIGDNGCGMDAETLQRVQSPFYSTRTTRSIGLGVPFFRMACEQTGGEFTMTSEPGRGTEVRALFKTDHIDMTPVGDMNDTVFLLITCNPELDFVYTRSIDGRAFTLDTRELREALDGVPLNSGDVVQWIRGYLQEAQESISASGSG